MRRLSWSIFSDFGENPFYKRASEPEIAKKFTKKPLFSISRLYKVIDVGTLGKLVSIAT